MEAVPRGIKVIVRNTQSGILSLGFETEIRDVKVPDISQLSFFLRTVFLINRQFRTTFGLYFAQYFSYKLLKICKCFFLICL